MRLRARCRTMNAGITATHEHRPAHDAQIGGGRLEVHAGYPGPAPPDDSDQCAKVKREETHENEREGRERRLGRESAVHQAEGVGPDHLQQGVSGVEAERRDEKQPVGIEEPSCGRSPAPQRPDEEREHPDAERADQRLGVGDLERRGGDQQCSDEQQSVYDEETRGEKPVTRIAARLRRSASESSEIRVSGQDRKNTLS